jgi:hypothetical protein
MRIMRLMVGILWLAGTVAMGQPMTFKDQAFLMAPRNLRLVPYWTPSNAGIVWTDNSGDHTIDWMTNFQANANLASVRVVEMNGEYITSINGLYTMPALTNLNIQANSLTNLDLSACVNLINLSASYNSLTEVNVTRLSELAVLDVANNGINTLDLTHNAKLLGVTASSNHLTNLDISGNPLLISVFCDVNMLTQAAVDEALRQLVVHGKNGMYAWFNGAGNAAPTAAGLGYKATLVARGWNVQNN